MRRCAARYNSNVCLLDVQYKEAKVHKERSALYFFVQNWTHSKQLLCRIRHVAFSRPFRTS